MTYPGSSGWTSNCEKSLQYLTDALDDFISDMINLDFNDDQIRKDVKDILEELLKDLR